MTHSGPFQPLLFCDSVIPQFRYELGTRGPSVPLHQLERGRTAAQPGWLVPCSKVTPGAWLNELGWLQSNSLNFSEKKVACSVLDMEKTLFMSTCYMESLY